MPTEVTLPQWGMGMNEGLVVKWLKHEGDTVEQGDPLVEIENVASSSRFPIEFGDSFLELSYSNRFLFSFVGFISI